MLVMSRERLDRRSHRVLSSTIDAPLRRRLSPKKLAALAGLDFSATRILGDSISAPSDVHQVGLYRMCGVLQKYSADQNIRSHTVLHTVLSRFGRALHTALSRFQTPFQEQNEWRVGVRLKIFFENVGDVAREGWTVELIVCCRRPSTLLFDDGCLRKNWSL
jgi:hypothetical protein